MGDGSATWGLYVEVHAANWRFYEGARETCGVFDVGVGGMKV